MNVKVGKHIYGLVNLIEKKYLKKIN